MTCFLDGCVSSICHHATPWVELFHVTCSVKSFITVTSFLMFIILTSTLPLISSSLGFVLLILTLFLFILSTRLPCS